MSPSSESAEVAAKLDAGRAAGMPEAEASRWSAALRTPCGCEPSAAAGVAAIVVALAATRGRSAAARAVITAIVTVASATVGRLIGIREEQRVYDGRLLLLSQRVAELGEQGVDESR